MCIRDSRGRRQQRVWLRRGVVCDRRRWGLGGTTLSPSGLLGARENSIEVPARRPGCAPGCSPGCRLQTTPFANHTL
eukprot:6444920-Pyramimonas_sp.AAC.1